MSKLFDRIFSTLVMTIHNVDTIGFGVLDVVMHKAPKTRKIGCDAGDSHHSAFRCRHKHIYILFMLCQQISKQQDKTKNRWTLGMLSCLFANSLISWYYLFFFTKPVHLNVFFSIYTSTECIQAHIPLLSLTHKIQPFYLSFNNKSRWERVEWLQPNKLTVIRAYNPTAYI